MLFTNQTKVREATCGHAELPLGMLECVSVLAVEFTQPKQPCTRPRDAVLSLFLETFI